jgi:hypothetical protein
LADAVQHFNVALKSQPDYFDAHYNLASALAAPEDFAGRPENSMKPQS